MTSNRISSLAVATLLAATSLFPAVARAGLVVPVVPQGATASGPLTIRHEHVTVEIDDQVARTTVLQTFENHTDLPMEGTFYFALPPDAAVIDFVQWIGDKKVGSVVVEKAAAEKEYAAQKAAGQAPALLEMFGPNKFQARIDSIPAHGVRKTEFSYSEILRYQGGEVGYAFPFKLDSLYTGTIDDFQIEVAVRDQKKITKLDAPWSGVAVKRVDEHAFHASMAAKTIKPAGDLTLSYQTESRQMGVNFLTYREPGKDGYFLLMLAPQELTTDADIVKKDVVFVFDKSGSMEGPKIEQARQALQLALGQMNEGDGFNIVSFSSGVDPYHNSILPVNPANLAAAKKYAQSIEAGGGTNIEGSMSAGLTELSASKRPTAIVFMTDGEPTVGEENPQRLLAGIKSANAKGTRIFTFGVGSDVNRPLLEQLGTENRGGVQFLDDGTRIDEAVSTFYKSIAHPVLAELKLDYGEVTAAMTYPDNLPDVYKGQQMILVGRYRGEGKTKVVLTGNVNGETKTFEIPVEFPAESATWGFLPRVWAQQRVAWALRQMRLHGENGEMKDEVITLAKQFRLATPYTSFVSKPVETEVASLTPARIKPGDPEIWIDAPADAHRVVLVFPFGMVKRAVFDPRAGKWVARFLIPRGTPDGIYPVKIAITLHDGTVHQASVRYVVDTHAPALAIDLAGDVRAGGALKVTVQPVVTALELIDSVHPGDLDGTLKSAKSLVDIKTVVAVTDDGRRIELSLGGDARGWHGTVETSEGTALGPHQLTVVATDYAGNVRVQRAPYQVSR